MRQHVIGDDNLNNDKTTVKRVQQQLHALSVSLKNPDFETYTTSYKDDGVMGAMTKHAVNAFNVAFGWPTDGPNITAGTIDALKRVNDMGPAAAQAHLVEQNAVQATTAPQVQAVAAQVTQAAAASSTAPPDVKAAAQAAQAKAMAAVTPQQVDAAKQDLERVAKKLKDATPEPSFFKRQVAGLPVWGWGAGAVGLTGLVFGVRALVKHFGHHGRKRK